MKTEPASADVLEAIAALATHVDHAIAKSVGDLETKMDKRFDKLETRMDKFETRMDKFETRMDRLEHKVDHLEHTVTEIHGDIVLLERREDRKLGALVDELLKRKVLDHEAANRILA